MWRCLGVAAYALWLHNKRQPPCGERRRHYLPSARLEGQWELPVKFFKTFNYIFGCSSWAITLKWFKNTPQMLTTAVPRSITQHLIWSSCCWVCDKLNRRFIIVSRKKRKKTNKKHKLSSVRCLILFSSNLLPTLKPIMSPSKHSKEELMREEFNGNGQIGSYPT